MNRENALAIDARHIHSGIGTYVSTLLRGLETRRAQLDYFVITQPTHRDRVAALTSAEIRNVDAPLYAPRGQWTIPRALRGSSVYHATQYDLPLVLGRPALVTIYDLTQMDRRFVPSRAAWLYAQTMPRLAARKAAHIFTISEYSRQQIVERLGVPETKVSVVYVAISDAFRPTDAVQARAAVQSQLALDRPYLLYVGNLKPHKDVPTLMRAFQSLRQRDIGDLELVIVGDDRTHAAGIRQLADQLGVAAQTRFIPHVAGDMLPSVYAAAACFVLPSHSEGFGLPVLEAMACGTPAVCASSSSLPEVGGDAAAYFAPGDSEELANVLTRVIENSAERQAMIARGFQQAKRFSVEQFVERHCEVYRRWLPK